MTLKEAKNWSRDQLRTIYEEGEASSITDWLMEAITGIKRNESGIGKDPTLKTTEQEQLYASMQRLLCHEPLQYVLNESWFCGLKFYVDKHVLIPRPETEELVEWIISNCKFPVDELSILDIGAGSGCIPVSLKRRIRKADVWGIDLSEDALKVARLNAERLGSDVEFIEMDFLNTENQDKLGKFDIIVSNPPYIPQKDKKTIAPNVLEYEPASALFVPGDDPLLFYRAIAAFGKTHLIGSGNIYTEIHESLGDEVMKVFQSAGYNAEIKKDMQGKDRMIRSGLV